MQKQIRYFDINKERQPQSGRGSFDLAGPTQWLKGEQKRLEDEAAKVGPPVGGRHYITPAHAAMLNEGFLTKASSEAYNYFASGMPQQYPLARHHDVRLVEELPHLGYCSFAVIRMAKQDGRQYVVRLHFANFNAKIDTTPGASFFDFKTVNRGAMFFGVAFSPNEAKPDSVVIDRSVHHQGISFITNDPAKALENAIVMRTGLSSQAWRRMAAQNSKVA